MDLDGLKSCPGCGRLLPKTDFAITRSKRSGVSSYCRGCLRSRNRRFKLRAFEALGGLRCIFCGEDGIDFLTVQHKLGGGRRHRSSGSWKSVIRDAMSTPEDYEVLCANCNHLDELSRLSVSRSRSRKASRQRELDASRRMSALQIVVGAGSDVCCSCCSHADVRTLCIDHIRPYSESPIGPRNTGSHR